MMVFLLGLLLFLGGHSVSIVAPGFRDRAVDRIGLRVWQGLYAIVALVGLVMVVRGYADLRGQTPILYVLPRWVHGLSTVIMIPVFPLLLAAYLPGAIKTATRHPMLIAVKLWALAHLLANGSLADIILFGSILVWAGVDRVSLKFRSARANPTAPANPWNDIIVVVGGLILYSLMLNGGHRLLIGMPLL